jgi:uncharacterized damage-inducible protein DinB
MSHRVPTATQSPQREIPTHGSGEKEMAWAWLRFARATVEAKVAGLGDELLARHLVPSPTTLAGILAHLTTVEQHWFSNVLGGQSLTMPFGEDLPDGDWMTDGVGVATLITRYRGACAASDEVIGALAMADTGAQETGDYTLRWALFHVLGDTMRHAGQADILREQTDGSCGW